MASARRSKSYEPDSGEPYKISRTKIELFLNCPRCFYLDQRLGVKRPSGPPFTLNSAVDTLLKKEFDIHRAKNTAHPLMKEYGIDAVPVAYEDLPKWRHNFTGIQFYHKPTNFLVYGAIDDLWARPHPKKKGELEHMIVDYKATAKAETVVELSTVWHEAYKRQMEIYQWLFRQNGFCVSDTGYFVYCTGKTDREAFDGKLEFDIVIIPYSGSDAWVENEIINAHKCLNVKEIPAPAEKCEYCAYRASAFEKEGNYN